MKLASYIRPFDVNQKIYVLDGYDTEDFRLAPLSTFEQAIMELMNLYPVEELELHGDENFCIKIKERVKDAELTRYNRNNLKVTLKGVS